MPSGPIMPQSRHIKIFCVKSVLFLCWLTSYCMGQSPDPLLVVVTDATDRDSVRRIGDKLVQVEPLFDPQSDRNSLSYEESNRRAQGLLEFRVLFFRVDTEPSVERFWRQRVAAANPNGHTLRLPQSRHRTDLERNAQRLKLIHGTLAKVLSDKREQLDTNLQLELNRLYSRGIPSVRVASHH